MVFFSVIIITYNSANIIRGCLDSVIKQSKNNAEFIIIDNNSDDDTRFLLKEHYSYLHLILNNHNRGFGGAVNQGIRISKGKFILILNDDITLKDDFFSKLDDVVMKLPCYIGMISPKILMCDKKTIDSTGLVLTKFRRFYDRGRGLIDKGQFDDKSIVFGPCAACGIYRKEALEQLKIGSEYFDEDFFLILEDFDVAWRARDNGWNGMFKPELICYHRGGISRKPSLAARYYSFRNRYLLLIKNEKAGNLLRLFLFALAYDIPRFIFIVFLDRCALRVIQELFTLTPKMLRKRRISKNCIG